VSGEPEYDAIVLAGGRSSRLGGVDKASLVVGGATLLDHAVGVVRGASRIVVVGPPRKTTLPVAWAREEPPGGGPVAAIAAALPLVEADITVVLACDMPGLRAETVSALVAVSAAAGDHDGALVSAAGRRQPLAAAYRTAALRSAVRALPSASGVAVRDLIAPLTLAEIAADPGQTADIDTWADLRGAPSPLDGP
jgi:molybdopterin-guanine dinucleotide biosynthesis protein A